MLRHSLQRILLGVLHLRSRLSDKLDYSVLSFGTSHRQRLLLGTLFDHAMGISHTSYNVSLLQGVHSSWEYMTTLCDIEHFLLEGPLLHFE